MSSDAPLQGSSQPAGEEICAYLIRCERALLDPVVRSNRAEVEALLAEDFQEFGSSGRIWDRATIVDLLAREVFTPPTAEQMHCARITADVALVTYRAVRIDSNSGTRTESLRSSLWMRKSGRWRMRFHQGTRAA